MTHQGHPHLTPASSRKAGKFFLDFPDKWAAIVWMCRNQLGRRNITDEQKTALIGEAYKAQKMTQGGERGTQRNEETGKFTARDQNGPLREEKKKYDNTAQKIADDFSIGEQTVKRAERFLDGLNEADKVSPGIKEAVLSGSVKAPKSVISEIRNAPEERRRRGARLRY